MNIGNIAVIVGVLLAVLTYLDFKPNGPRILAGIWARVRRLWARIQASRKRLEVLEQRVKALEEASARMRDNELSLHLAGERGSAHLTGMDEVLPRIEVLENVVLIHEQRMGGRPPSPGVDRIHWHAELKRQLGEDGSFSDAPRGR
jgi:hypothetical protein